MKVPQREKDNIIKGLLPTLAEFNEQAVQYVQMSGRQLMEAGAKTDGDGKLLKPGLFYKVPKKVLVPVNHKRRIVAIMDRATNGDDLTTLLGEYVVKYGIKYQRPEPSTN